MTIVDDVLDRAGGSGTLTVLGADADDESTVSWSRLHQRARRMATTLAAAGVGRGSRVGLLGGPSTHFVAALQAVWLAGASITVLPPPAGRGAAQRLRAVVTDAGLDPVIADNRIAAGVSAALAPARVLPLAALVSRAEGVAPTAVQRPDPADLAVLQYTSGSTRFPHGVPVTHRHLAAQLAAMKGAVNHDPGDPHRLLSWLPLHHDMGLVGFLCYPMSTGCPLVLQSPAAFVMRPATWLAALSRYHSTLTGAPNFAYRLLIPLLEAGLAVDLSSVRLMVSGGEPVDPAAMTRFAAAAARYGLDPKAIMPAYGLAEATLTVTCSRAGAGLHTDVVDPDRLEREGRAVPARPGGRARTLARLGRPVRGVRLRIVDPDTGVPVREREIGEVEVHGASVVGHYWKEPAPAADAWLRTGDLGYLAEGDLVLCGRRKDVLFAAGRNLYPPDIELAADQVPGVRPGGAVAFGVPGEQGDQLVVAVEARSPDRVGLIRAVAVAVAAETGMRPARVFILPPGGLPRTTSGKLRRAEARRRYVNGELAEAALPTPPATVGRQQPTIPTGHTRGRGDDHLDHSGTSRVARKPTVPRPARSVSAGTRDSH